MNNYATIAVDIFEKVLSYPLKQIVQNVGVDSPDVIFQKIKSEYYSHYGFSKYGNYTESNYGYDARSRTTEYNLIEKGVIDPLKVVYTALSQANSIASTIIRTGGAVVFEKSDQKTLEDLMSSNMSL